MAILNKRNIAVGVIVVGVVVALSYRYALKPQMTKETGGDLIREVSVAISYQVPNGTDKVRFALGLDTDGRVVSVRSTDVLAGNVTDEKLDEFSNNLLLVIRGKKLNELESIDRVGTSTLTTDAFNSALPSLKSQL